MFAIAVVTPGSTWEGAICSRGIWGRCWGWWVMMRNSLLGGERGGLLLWRWGPWGRGGSRLLVLTLEMDVSWRWPLTETLRHIHTGKPHGEPHIRHLDCLWGSSAHTEKGCKPSWPQCTCPLKRTIPLLSLSPRECLRSNVVYVSMECRLEECIAKMAGYCTTWKKMS